MSDIKNMRDRVANAYKGDKWKKKVKHMPDNQVIAIYISLQNRRKKVN